MGSHWTSACAVLLVVLGLGACAPGQGQPTQLQNRLLAMIRSGAVAPNQEALRRASVQLITDDPGGWFSLTGQRYQHTDTVYVIGSGFFARQDGYLLTNAHVLTASADEGRRLSVCGGPQG